MAADRPEKAPGEARREGPGQGDARAPRRRGRARGGRLAPRRRGEGPEGGRGDRDARRDGRGPSQSRACTCACSRGAMTLRAGARWSKLCAARQGCCAARSRSASGSATPRSSSSSTTMGWTTSRTSSESSRKEVERKALERSRNRSPRKQTRSATLKALYRRVTYQAPRHATISRTGSVRVRPSTTNVSREPVTIQSGFCQPWRLGVACVIEWPSSSEANCARPRSWWRCDSARRARWKGRATRFSHSLPGIRGVARGDPAVAREEDVARQVAVVLRDGLEEVLRAHGELLARGRRNRVVGGRRRRGRVGARRSRASSATVRRCPGVTGRSVQAAAPATVGCHRESQQSDAARDAAHAPGTSRARAARSREHRERDQAHVEDLVERLDLRQARLGRARLQPQLGASGDAPLEDRVRDLLDVDAVPLEHRRGRSRTSPPCPSSG